MRAVRSVGHGACEPQCQSAALRRSRMASCQRTKRTGSMLRVTASSGTEAGHGIHVPHIMAADFGPGAAGHLDPHKRDARRSTSAAGRRAGYTTGASQSAGASSVSDGRGGAGHSSAAAQTILAHSASPVGQRRYVQPIEDAPAGGAP